MTISLIRMVGTVVQIHGKGKALVSVFNVKEEDFLSLLVGYATKPLFVLAGRSAVSIEVNGVVFYFRNDLSGEDIDWDETVDKIIEAARQKGLTVYF